MFKPIIGNNLTPDMKAYNRLISKKPTHGDLQEKVRLQRVWREDCNKLLEEIRHDSYITGIQ